MACAQALNVNQLLFLISKLTKPCFSMMSIKTLLQDMHSIHSGTLVRENQPASTSGFSFCGPCIFTMNSQNPQDIKVAITAAK